MSAISVNIKCSNNDKATITVELTSTVLDMKQLISDSLNVPASQQRLIYKGRVMKDELTVEFYQIQDGHTVHMVKGAAPVASTPAAAAPAASTTSAPTSAPAPFATNPNPAGGRPFGASPYGASPFGASPFGASPFGGMNPTGANGMPDINRMQEQLMRNPEMMQQILNSPMMDNLMNNPEMMRNMMVNNPQMQAMLDRNPQVRHMLNDPAVSCKFCCVDIIMICLVIKTVYGDDA